MLPTRFHPRHTFHGSMVVNAYSMSPIREDGMCTFLAFLYLRTFTRCSIKKKNELDSQDQSTAISKKMQLSHLRVLTSNQLDLLSGFASRSHSTQFFSGQSRSRFTSKRRRKLSEQLAMETSLKFEKTETIGIYLTI